MQSFTRKSLFASAKEKWPPRYRISYRAPRSGAVITDPSISENYRRIEGEIGSDDEWSQLAAWAFYQALSNVVEDGFRSGKSIVEKDDVTFEQFDQKMKLNLEDKSWENDRYEYYKSHS